MGVENTVRLLEVFGGSQLYIPRLETLTKDESTSEEKAFELMQKMYPEAFKPKVPEFSVSTTGVSGIRDKRGFLAGFTGNRPL